MSLAADTRAAVRARPFLHTALRAELVNFSAAAAWLVDDAGLDGDVDAVATALRRYASDLEPYDTDSRRATVSMQSGVGVRAGVRGGGDGRDDEQIDAEETSSHEEPLCTIGGDAIVPGGEATAIMATGDVDAVVLTAVLDRLGVAEIDVSAAAVLAGTLLVVVPRRDGPGAVRQVEAVLDAVPERR